MMNITDKSIEDKITPLLRLGFRPFFLLGGIYAPLAIAIWVYAFQHGQPEQLHVPALWWHVHEMIFGFAMAIVAGFLLTAVQNWTGVNGTKDKALAAVVLLWLLPRVLFWTTTPLWVISVIEAIFLAVVAYEISFRVIKAKGYRNLIFLAFFVLAIVANFAAYATIDGSAPFSATAVWEAMIWWFVLLISIMGGRVIPFFTARRMEFDKPNPILWLEAGANTPLVCLFVLSFFPSVAEVASPALMIFAAVMQLVRFLRWKPWTTLKEPLVWSLHASYACIPVGLLLKGLALVGVISNGYFVSHNMIHVLAIGGIAGLILAMIARVTMGHTGRKIYEGPGMWHAFLAVVIAGLTRGIGVAFWPEHMMQLINISAALWIYAFVLFTFKFGPMLCKARADGHPG
ncbi:short-chain dehydrogenase [Vibrio sp. S11_S32]|uniref:NnrS family protein n=1 Tax=Vibrio sp. S11_S32 TaxID=2720225 RepID=UPI0016819CC1|nr:NnrS family protein [Vibrio sp. S11_S32]MBD1576464.1 short-chain dehydrogenase [Vibrio sp. S11_S32]